MVSRRGQGANQGEVKKNLLRYFEDDPLKTPITKVRGDFATEK